MSIAYLWVAIGGAIGSLGRFWAGDLVAKKFVETSAVFPLGTLAVNIAGSFIIGFLAAVASPEGRLNPQTRVLATQMFMTGLCGGFTTFSSFSLQTLNLMRDGEWLYAGGNVLLSVVLCLIAVWLGFTLGATLNTMKGN